MFNKVVFLNDMAPKRSLNLIMLDMRYEPDTIQYICCNSSSFTQSLAPILQCSNNARNPFTLVMNTGCIVHNREKSIVCLTRTREGPVQLAATKKSREF